VKSPEEYLKELQKRGKESRVFESFQLHGLEIAQMLGDPKHKALYIKLAKKHDIETLRRLAGQVNDNPKIRNKGAYFMTCLKKTLTP
jgi:hypothetical protein